MSISAEAPMPQRLFGVMHAIHVITTMTNNLQTPKDPEMSHSNGAVWSHCWQRA